MNYDLFAKARLVWGIATSEKAIAFYRQTVTNAVTCLTIAFCIFYIAAVSTWNAGRALRGAINALDGIPKYPHEHAADLAIAATEATTDAIARGKDWAAIAVQNAAENLAFWLFVRAVVAENRGKQVVTFIVRSLNREAGQLMAIAEGVQIQ